MVSSELTKDRRPPKLATLATTVLASMALILSSALPANATPSAESALDPDLVTEVTSVWTTYGVSAEDQEDLLSKMSNGEPLDSMTGEAAIAIDQIENDAELIEVQRFTDGSINVLTFETPAEPETESGEVSTKSVTNCSASGSRRNDCSVYGWFTAVQLGFLATYVLTTGSSKILSYSQPIVQCFSGINCQAPFFSVTRLNQSGSLAAQVSLGVSWNYIVVGGGSTTYLHLYVRDQSAWTN